MDYSILDNRLITSCNLISSDSLVIDYCKENRLFTLKDFICSYENNGVISNDNDVILEVKALVDMIKFKYFKELNFDLLYLMGISSKNISVNGTSYFCNNYGKDMDIFRRLGFTNYEIYFLMNYVGKYNKKNIAEVISMIVESGCCAVYFDKYICSTFKSKCFLIKEYYKLLNNDDLNNSKKLLKIK